MKEFVVAHMESGQRLDKYISKILVNAPMSFSYKMLRKKNITLNGKKADGKEKLETGDIVRFFLADDTFEKFSKANTIKKRECFENDSSSQKLDFSNSGLKIIYEDEDILIFHKPQGILSQKAKESDISVNDYLLSYLNYHPDEKKACKPSICNRLDRNTSGLILCGKTMPGLSALSQVLKDRTLQKYYRCIVSGKMSAMDLKGYLKKDEKTNKVMLKNEFFEGSSFIETSFCPVETFECDGKSFTELEVHLITGKTHQIRSHLSFVNHPIVGDRKYGNAKINELAFSKYKIKDQMLHAYRVVFPKDFTLPALAGKEFVDPKPALFDKMKESR